MKSFVVLNGMYLTLRPLRQNLRPHRGQRTL